jgi:hypothetical protein
MGSAVRILRLWALRGIGTKVGGSASGSRPAAQDQEVEMTQTQVRATKTRQPQPLDLRSPSGRRLPF